MALSLVSLLLLLHALVLSAQPLPDALLFHRVVLDAQCADGSPATLYYRNCSANWDRKPGGPDYCARALNPVVTWVISFLPDASALGPLPPSLAAARAVGAADAPGAMPFGPAAGAYCYSDASCASRAANLSGSAWQPAVAFAGGVVSPFAEVNPNLYKQHSVLIPTCTGDLFAGERGQRVVAAALAALFSPAVSSSAAAADRMVLVGGAGVLAHADALADRLRALKAAAGGGASLAVFAVCAGCLLPFATPAYAGRAGPPCTTDADCPPADGLPALAAYARLPPPAGCAQPGGRAAGACYSAEVLAPALARARTPVLVAQQLFDAALAAAAGVDARAPLAGAAAQWAQAALAPTLRAAAAAASPFVFAPACALPVDAMVSAEFYAQKVNRTDAYNNTAAGALGAALPAFLEAAAEGGGGVQAWGRYRDCGDVGCNPTCRV